MSDRTYDIVIVGAGVIGAAIAWRLSELDLDILWLEAAHDVAEGASKGNSGITASGYDVTPGTLECELVRTSSPQWEAICDDLDVPFRRGGSFVLAFTSEDEARLDGLRAQAATNGVETAIVSGSEARSIAPAVSEDARAALHVPSEGIIDPMRLTLGYAEVAARNGVELRLNSEVTAFRHDAAGRVSHIETTQGAAATRYVVNAAGLNGDTISRLAGAERFSIWPRKGQFLVVDRDVGAQVTTIIGSLPTAQTRGVLAVPTTNGSLLLGPTAEDGRDKSDRDTDEPTLDVVLEQATRLLSLPISRGDVIKTFAGLRPASTSVYRIERSRLVPNLVQAAAIRSTGVSSSPAVAARVLKLLCAAGLESRPRSQTVRRLPRVPRLAELRADEIASAATEDEGYGVVVCACEHVSAAEIRRALEGPLAATSLGGVRKRTRAGGGRCQGSYCLAGIGFILSMRNGLAPWQIPETEPAATWGTGAA